ncbi:MAG: branched-chain amino acid ABC transporter permease [Alphaproteobacteria bacterium]
MDGLILFIQQLVTGISIGCVYALVALGFVLIYKATEVVNFAQGELMMVGAFFAYTFVDLGQLPFAVGVLLAFACTAMFGALINFLVLRRLIGSSAFTIVLATVGLATLVRAIAGMIPGWGTQTHRLSNPFAGKTVDIGGVIVSSEHLMVIGVTVLLVSALYAFFTFTRVGIALQATSQNQLASGYVGIPVRSMFSLIWAISAAVSAIAGVLIAPLAFVHSNMGYIGLKAFPAAVLGGFGSLPGAVIGGLIIGIVEELAGLYLPEGFKSVAAYVVLLGVLMIRPQGLFGYSKRVRV